MTSSFTRLITPLTPVTSNSIESTTGNTTGSTLCDIHRSAVEYLVEDKALTLVDLLRSRATYQADQLAYIFLQDGESESNRVDYKTLDRRARAIAANLQSQNAVGERALLVYPPGLEFIAAFFGCLYAGAIAVPAYPPRRNQNMSRLQSIVTSSQATIALTTTDSLKSIEKYFSTNEDLAHLRWIATDEIDLELSDRWQMPAAIDPESLAFLQYTSGSTGTPKGVMVSQRNVMHNLGLIHQNFAITPKSVGVSWLPPYHDMGLIGGILQPLYGGAPMVLMPPMAFLQKPIRWLQAISKFKATTSGGPNFAFDLCARRVKPEQLQDLDLSRWKTAFTGAEPIRANTLHTFAEAFSGCGFQASAFHPCYGMAETTLIVSGANQGALPVIRNVNIAALEKNKIQIEQGDRADSQAIVSCGHSLRELQVVIVDPQRLTSCCDHQVGEVWVAGDSVAQGYWNQPSLSDATFRAYLAATGSATEATTASQTDSGPFLRTGDLGFLLNGELFITGRIKDLMIIRGQNHYPQDVEFTVESSHSALRPAAGAAFTIEIKGEERLVVVQEVERNYLRKLNVEEVVNNIRQEVSRQCGLQIYATVLVKPGSIPRTSSGKIQRYACREKFLAGTLNVVEDWSENPQGRIRFVALKDEVDSLLQKLS